MKILNKTVKFIYEVYHKVIYPIKLAKTLHQRIIQIDVTELDESQGRNPYQVFFDWLLEIIQYGTLIELMVSFFVGFHWLNIVRIPFWGLIRWLMFDMLKDMRKALK